MSRLEGSALATAGATPRCRRRLTDLCASAREIGRGEVAVEKGKRSMVLNKRKFMIILIDNGLDWDKMNSKIA